MTEAIRLTRFGWIEPLCCLGLLAVLYLAGLGNFLLFHTLAELFCIAVAWGVFMIVWNTRHQGAQPFFLVLGVAFLYVGLLDLVHTLSYKGMGVFPGSGANQATQFWIAARYAQTAAFLLALLSMERTVRVQWVIAGFALATATACVGILAGSVFPECFRDGECLTPFKKTSEFLICIGLIAAALRLQRLRGFFEPSSHRLMLAALVVSILSEIAFTRYISVYSPMNMAGHILKLVAFYLIYRAIIVIGLKRPYEFLFQSLEESRQALSESEGRFKVLYEEAPIAYQSLDEAGRIVAVNTAWLETLNYPREEVIGRPLSDFIDPEWREYMTYFRDAIRESGRVSGAEVRLIRKNGQSFLAAFNAEIATNAQGEVHVHAVFQDISREKVARQALMESRERFRIAAQCVSDLIFEWEAETGRLEWYGNIDSALGYARSVFPRSLDGLLNRVHEADRVGVKAVFENADAKSGGQPVIFRIRKKSGNWRHWQMRGDQVPGDSVAPVRVIGICADITDRRRSDDMLSLHVAVLEQMVQGRPMAELFLKIMIQMDALLPETRTALLLQDADSGRFRVTMAPDMPAALKHAMEQALLARAPSGFADTLFTGTRLIIEDIHMRTDWEADLRGQMRESGFQGCWAEPILSESGVVLGAMLICLKDQRMMDPAETPLAASLSRLLAMVIQKKQNEKALRESEERFRQLAENIEEVFWVMDQGRITYVSPACTQIFGDGGRSLFASPRAYLEAVHPDDREILRKDLKTREQALRQTDIQYRILRPDGEIRWVWDRTFPIREPSGVGRRFVGVIQDITGVQLAQSEILRLATAIEHLDETILITDASGRIQYVNAAFERLTGYGRQDVIGRRPSMLRSGLMPPDFYRDMWETILQKRTWKGALTNRRKDGSLYEKEMSITPLLDEGGHITHFVSVSRDVTRQKQLEALLRQSQKMEAIGTLAGGIAHDFNNILFPIIGYTEMLLSDAEKSDDMKRKLNEILKAAGRATDLVRQILAFSRQTEQELKPMRIQSILKEVVKLSRASLPSTIAIRQNIDPACGMVMGDPTQIHQIVMNLMTNAYHAMQEKGGDLRIGLTEVVLEETRLPGGDLKPGPHVCIEVADTGTGMDPGIMDRIFEPYFTTKEKGKGTGLGLSVVLGIVKSYGGAVKVHSELGKGTTFQVYLPRLEADIAPAKKTIEEPLPGGHERILLVDDEDPIARMEKQMLERLGYEVTVQNAPDKALELFLKDTGYFDLIITDMTMPQMTGDRLARKMMAVRPDLPVIICTGFSELITEESARSMGIREMILKPVLSRDLSYAVRRALKGNSAAHTP